MSPDVIALAKAGDRKAVDAVLQDALPALRVYVRIALRAMPATVDVFDDAIAMALEKAWQKLASWDPQRGALATYIRPGVHSATRRLAAKFSARRTRSLDAPRAEDDATPLVESLAGEPSDPEPAIDVRRVLAALPQSADLLLRAQVLNFQEIADEDGMSREYANRLYRRALTRARAVVGGTRRSPTYPVASDEPEAESAEHRPLESRKAA